MVSEKTSKGVMVTVVASSLRNVFQFHICGLIQSDFFPFLKDILSQEVLSDNRDVPVLEGKIAFEGDFSYFFVSFDGNSAYLGFMITNDLGH
jgi:hypothetical protein